VPRVPRPVLSTVICLLAACVMLFAGSLNATSVPTTSGIAVTAAEALLADRDLALTASDGEDAHASVPMPAESEPATSGARAPASRCPIDGQYLAASTDEGPRARSPAYRGCGPPR